MTDLEKIKRTIRDISNLSQIDVKEEAAILSVKLERVRQGLAEILVGMPVALTSGFMIDDTYVKTAGIVLGAALALKGTYVVLTRAEELRDVALYETIENKLRSAELVKTTE